MTKKLTFIHDDGQVSTRRTDRPYTHVVVGRVDLVAARALIEQHSRAGETWDSQHYMSRIKVGERIWKDKTYLMKQADADKYAAFIEANPFRGRYIEDVNRAGLERLARQHGTADKSPEYVLSWSMSPANAEKTANQVRKHHVDVRVLPIATCL